MLIQLIKIYICKGRIAVKVQLLLLVTEDKQVYEFLPLLIVVLHLDGQHLSVFRFRFCLDIEHQFLHAFKRPVCIMINSDAEIVTKQKEELVIVKVMIVEIIRYYITMTAKFKCTPEPSLLC